MVAAAAGRKSPVRGRSPPSSPRARTRGGGASGLTKAVELPKEVRIALNLEGKTVSYTQIPAAMQQQIDPAKRDPDDKRLIPVDAVKEPLRKLIDMDGPLTDMEMTRRLWEKIRKK
jgi:hypothetical protein